MEKTKESTTIVNSGCRQVQNKPKIEPLYWSLMFLRTNSFKRFLYFFKFLRLPLPFSVKETLSKLSIDTPIF